MKRFYSYQDKKTGVTVTCCPDTYLRFTNRVLRAGGVYKAHDGVPFRCYKVSDGFTPLKHLPFLDKTRAFMEYDRIINSQDAGREIEVRLLEEILDA